MNPTQSHPTRDHPRVQSQGSRGLQRISTCMCWQGNVWSTAVKPETALGRSKPDWRSRTVRGIRSSMMGIGTMPQRAQYSTRRWTRMPALRHTGPLDDLLDRPVWLQTKAPQVKQSFSTRVVLISLFPSINYYNKSASTFPIVNQRYFPFFPAHPSVLITRSLILVLFIKDYQSCSLRLTLRQTKLPTIFSLQL